MGVKLGGDLLIIVSAGYLFTTACFLTYFRGQALGGYRLVFESFLIGSIFLWVANQWIYPHLVFAFGLPLASTDITSHIYLSATTWAISLFWAFICNLVMGAIHQKKLFDKGIIPETKLDFSPIRLLEISRAHINRLHVASSERKLVEFLWWTMENRKLALVTLDNRKCYIGYVIQAPNLLKEVDESFAFLVKASGYRKPKTLKFKIEDDNYDFDVQDIMNQGHSAIERQRKINEFATMIRYDTVISANRFTPEVYNRLR